MTEQTTDATTTPELDVAVITGSTRPGRRSRAVADWVMSDHSRPDIRFELVDLLDLDLPMLAEPVPAIFGDYRSEHTRHWSTIARRFDAYVLVTPEYNSSTSAVLKNALDHLHAEWKDKPVAFVGYGVHGGTRAIEHLRGITAELGMAGIGASVHLPLNILSENRCAAEDNHNNALATMLGDLARWGQALRPLRSATAAPM